MLGISKGKFLFILVILAFISFLLLAASGILLWVVIPKGSTGGGHGAGSVEYTLIWDRHVWTDIHNWTSVAFIVVIILHIYMHWKWLWRQTKSLLKR
jgi:hypothetical protein